MNNELKNRLEGFIKINELSMSMTDIMQEIINSDSILKNEYMYIKTLAEHLIAVNDVVKDYGDVVAEIYHGTE